MIKRDTKQMDQTSYFFQFSNCLWASLKFDVQFIEIGEEEFQEDMGIKTPSWEFISR